MGRFINADVFASTGQGLLGNNMFGYCGNNSVNFADYSGQASVHFAPMLRMESPHSPNYILDQDNNLIGSLPLGSSTVGRMGCGVVATYNALLSLGDYHTFDEVYKYYTSTPHRLAGNGEYGISFFTISSYFSDLGYKVLTTCNPQQIDRASRNADACILLYNYYNQKLGGHFIEYSRYGSSYLGRNTATASGIGSFISPAEYGYAGNRIFAIAILIYEWPS
jgi:hypothetical protein